MIWGIRLYDQGNLIADKTWHWSSPPGWTNFHRIPIPYCYCWAAILEFLLVNTCLIVCTVNGKPSVRNCANRMRLKRQEKIVIYPIHCDKNRKITLES